MASSNVQQNLIPNEPELADLLALFKKNIFLEFNSHHLATIQSFNSSLQTATATVNYKKTFFELNQQTQTYQPVLVDYPLLVDCPVICLGGGTGSLTFPIAQGDECLVFFNDRDIDNWFAGSSGGPVATPRLHSFSDGIILVGVRSKGKVLSTYDTARSVLRNKDAFVGISQTKIRVANATQNLNTILQNIMTQLETLANTVAINGSPLNPSVATQLSTLATDLGNLLD